MKKKVHLLPNALTAFGLTCGLFVIFRMNMVTPGALEQTVLIKTAAILLLAGFLDLLDGFVARVMKAESTFGGIFDSTADAITFGVTPSVIVLKTLSSEPGSELAFFVTLSAMVFSVSGVLRLVRFSVTAQKAKEDIDLLEAHNKNFTGLPIPAAAAAAVSANLFLFSTEIKQIANFDAATKTWIMFFTMLFLGYLMVSRWKFPSFKTLQIRVTSFRLILFIVATASAVFWGIFHNFPFFFFALSWIYIVVAIFLSIVRIISGKKSKTLIDFEPEPEELEWDQE